MRYEAKTLEEAVAGAARALGQPEAELKYTVIRDEKSFWGGRVVEIEVEEGRGGRPQTATSDPRIDEDDTVPAPPRRVAPSREKESREKQTRLPAEAFGGPVPAASIRESVREPVAGATDAEAVATVESTLTELLSAAGLLVEIRRRESTGDELLFELIGDDVEPLLANKGEGLTGLEVLVGRIAAKRLGRPVHPRLDADGFRAHRKDALEELARQSAEEVRRSRRPSLLPPLAPWERRLVHLALAEDSEVETQSEGDGFLKRVEVRLKSR